MILHQHAQRCVSWVSLDSIKFILTIQIPSLINLTPNQSLLGHTFPPIFPIGLWAAHNKKKGTQFSFQSSPGVNSSSIVQSSKFKPPLRLNNLSTVSSFHCITQQIMGRGDGSVGKSSFCTSMRSGFLSPSFRLKKTSRYSHTCL